MRALPLLLLAAAMALPAAAQPAVPPQPPPQPHDVIGVLLDGRPPPKADRDEDEPDTAGKRRTFQEVEPSGPRSSEPASPPVSYAPIPYASRLRTQRDAPVYIGETGKTPDGPPAVRDMTYDGRIRASFAAAEGFQGPLDGGWTLAGADGQGLYALQLVDKTDRLEGVWRDLRRKGALNASGLVDDIQRLRGELTLRFAAEPGKPVTVATLHAGTDGWIGDLAEGGQSRKVTLRRTAP